MHSLQRLLWKNYHIGGSSGVVPKHLDSKHDHIDSRVSYYQFEHKITHKTCKVTLAHRRLVFELLGRSLTLNLQTLQDWLLNLLFIILTHYYLRKHLRSSSLSYLILRIFTFLLKKNSIWVIWCSSNLQALYDIDIFRYVGGHDIGVYGCSMW